MLHHYWDCSKRELNGGGRLKYVWGTEREIWKYNPFETARCKTAVYHTYRCQLQGDRRCIDAERFREQCQHSFDSFAGNEFCRRTYYYAWKRIVGRGVRVGEIQNSRVRKKPCWIQIKFSFRGVLSHQSSLWLITIQDNDIQLQHIRGV